ncbi:BQ2448_4955 [Microbotryum intermedium]|uniref:BQ2448_4955 protein n=1 Tax=Microbotryum intermedium TaxID=269621 RepID=A0A238FJC9_9BASI|nr:BQ2448_4955 [Microbotryum intermedium]
MILDSTLKNGLPEMTQRYQDAVAGSKPPEIKPLLGPDERAHDRPDFISRVFDRLCDDVLGNKNRAGWFGALLTHTHVIEYLKRSLPYAHMLITLAPDDHPLTTEAIDKIISAEIPYPARYPDL